MINSQFLCSQGTDPEDVIKNAFGCFDETNSGFINEEYLRELLISMGDRFTDEDVSWGSMCFTDDNVSWGYCVLVSLMRTRIGVLCASLMRTSQKRLLIN